MLAEEERRNKEEADRMAAEMERRNKEEADRLAVAEILLQDITATVLDYYVVEAAETSRRNKEAEEALRLEEVIRKEVEAADAARREKEAADAAEAIRLEEVIRKEKEDAEQAKALQEEEEAKAADEERRRIAEAQRAGSGFHEVPVTSAEQPEGTSGEGMSTVILFRPIVLRPEEYTFSPQTSTMVAEMQGYMTSVAETVERSVSMVMKSLADNQKKADELLRRDAERQQKEILYDSSLSTLFDIVKKGEEERRRDKELRLKEEQEKLAREAEEEHKRHEQFQRMLDLITQRTLASTSTPPPPPPP